MNESDMHIKYIPRAFEIIVKYNQLSMLNNHHGTVNEDKSVRNPSSNRKSIDNGNSYERIVFKEESHEINYKDILSSDDDKVVTDKTQSDKDNKFVTLTMYATLQKITINHLKLLTKINSHNII